MAKRKIRGRTMLDRLQNASTSEQEVETNMHTQMSNCSGDANVSETRPYASASVSKRRGRGPSKGPRLERGEKIMVDWNELVQPFVDNRNRFVSYLGKLARNSIKLPVTYAQFTDVPEDILSYIWTEIQENTNAPPNSKTYCLQEVNNKWRNFKSSLKSKYFTGKTKEEYLAIVPSEIDEEQWKVLVDYWNLDKVKEASEINKRNRDKLGPLHRTGRTSCVNFRKQMELDGKPTDRLSVYIAMRTDKSGNPKDDLTAELIAQFNMELDQEPPEEQELVATREKIFLKVMGHDAHGRVRTMGTGPTPAQINGKKSAPQESYAEYEERLTRKIEERYFRAIGDEVSTMRAEIAFLKSQLAQTGSTSSHNVDE